MKSTWIIITIAIISGVVWYISTGFGGQHEQDIRATSDEEETFVKAPEFSLEDFNGNMVSSKDFAERVMVVNSWAVWCPFCKNELPDFARLQEFFGDEVAVIAIDRAESLEKAREFTDSIGVTDKFVFLLDPKDSFYKDIGGFSMPETIFVDKTGNIRLHKRGPMDFEEMKEEVLEIQRTE